LSYAGERLELLDAKVADDPIMSGAIIAPPGQDSPAEEKGFEPSVPRRLYDAFEPAFSSSSHFRSARERLYRPALMTLPARCLPATGYFAGARREAAEVKSDFVHRQHSKVPA
jgi:hypothetical protein